MPEKTLKEFLAGLTIEETKKMIFSLIEQFFPVMEESERQDFVLKLLGKSDNDKLSSMVNR